MKSLGDQWTFAATDLSDHLGCAHLSTLNRLEAAGSISRPEIWDPLLDILSARGRDHELAFLESLRASGHSIAQPDPTSSTSDWMQRGVSVIFQAPLHTENWQGRADFLMRVERPSNLGSWSYEAIDTRDRTSARPVGCSHYDHPPHAGCSCCGSGDFPSRRTSCSGSSPDDG